MPWRFSRTHSQTYKVCPKLYYKTYHEQGTGIVPTKLNLGLSRGILTHNILRGLLSYCVEHDKQPPAEHIRKTINENVAAFRKEALDRGFDLLNDQYLQLEVDRQACLIEGMIRAWASIRLPFILASFKVVQVEEEFDVELSDDVTLMCRLDGVLQRRSDGEYSALEFKTTGTTDDDYFESWRYATQTMFHLLAIEKQFKKPGLSVMMEFLATGTKRNDKMSGMDIYYSPLVRGFVKYGAPPVEPEREYGWETELGRKKSWNVINIWEAQFDEKPDWMSNSEYWVEHVLPREVLGDQLYTREIFRNPDELAETVENTVAQQRRIYQGIQLLANGNDPKLLAQFFPGHLDENCRSNKWRKACPMLPLCYKEIEGDPLESGKYQRREPHHPGEMEV